MRITHLIIAFLIYGGNSWMWAQEGDQPANLPSDSTGILFRIQDYVPGEFQSRLRWFTLNANSSPEIKGWPSAYNLGNEGGLVDKMIIPLNSRVSFTPG